MIVPEIYLAINQVNSPQAMDWFLKQGIKRPWFDLMEGFFFHFYFVAHENVSK
jgi:hypothetical protein